MAEEEVQEPVKMVVKPKSVDGRDHYSLADLPLGVTLEKAFFDYAEVSKFERRCSAAGDITGLKELRDSVTHCTIRVKKTDEGGLLSNCKFVEFSDGTGALVFGGHVVFNQLTHSQLKGQYVFDSTTSPMLRVVGPAIEKRIYQRTTPFTKINYATHKQQKAKLAPKRRRVGDSNNPEKAQGGGGLNAQLLEDD